MYTLINDHVMVTCKQISDTTSVFTIGYDIQEMLFRENNKYRAIDPKTVSVVKLSSNNLTIIKLNDSNIESSEQST